MKEPGVTLIHAHIKVDSGKVASKSFGFSWIFRFSVDSHQKQQSGRAAPRPHVQRGNLSFHLDFKGPRPCGSTFSFKETEICWQLNTLQTYLRAVYSTTYKNSQFLWALLLLVNEQWLRHWDRTANYLWMSRFLCCHAEILWVVQADAGKRIGCCRWHVLGQHAPLKNNSHIIF